MTIMIAAALLAVPLASVQAQTIPPVAVKPDPTHITAIMPADIPWRVTGPGQEYAYLVGDPAKPGPYVVLVRWQPNSFSRPHFHSSDRWVTVIKGTWWSSSSSTFDPATSYPYPAGSFVTDLAGKMHWDGAKGEEVIIQIVGMGPVMTTRMPQ